MGMRNYYFLVAGLPDLTIDQGKLQFGSVEFKEYLKGQLHKKDYLLVEWLFLPHDNSNLLKLLQKEEFKWNPYGIYTQEELELAISGEEVLLKPYMELFINNFKAEVRLMPEKSLENELTALYFNEALKIENAFLNNWLQFELNLKNTLLYASSQKYDIPFENELIGDTPIVNALRNKSGRDVGDAGDWPYYEKIIQLVESGDIATREKAIDQIRWGYLDELNTFEYFSVEVILSYLIKLTIIERWLILDPRTGEELFRRLLGDLQSSYEFPKEFNLNDGKK